MAADPSPTTESVAYLGLGEVRRRLESGELTSVALVEQLLRRIAEVDRVGPEMRAVLALCPDATDVARRLDEERRSGAVRGPLHGIPVLVKDNIDTAGEPGTTAGSLALTLTLPSSDATVVRLLRGAGAIVLAKANLSEWANFRGRNSSSGWSAVGGQCRNPFALDRSPGGSSSGSGAGVAAGLAPLAVGTETDGSILCPAGLNGVVGIKPTVGLVSRAGIVPISVSQDTAGPLARSVSDAAELLNVLAAADPADPGSAARPTSLPGDYAAYCVPDGLAGARIGVARGKYFMYNPRMDVVVEAALAIAGDAGAIIVDPADIPTANDAGLSEDELTVLLYEFNDGLERYLRGRPADDGSQPRTLAELAAFNETHAEIELAHFGQEIMVDASTAGGLEESRYLEARDRNWRRTREDGIDAALAASGADVIAVPTMSPAWCIDHVNGDSHRGSGFQVPAIAGYPSISVPVGKVGALPVGLTLMGTAWSEPMLIRIAYGLERALALGDGLRPGFLPTAD
jgi:amidase